MAEELQNGPLEGDEKELLMLLTTPHVKVYINIYTQTHLSLSFLNDILSIRESKAFSTHIDILLAGYPLSHLITYNNILVQLHLIRLTYKYCAFLKKSKGI